MMSRKYESNGEYSRYPMDDYLERITAMQRMPSTISDYPEFVYEVPTNNHSAKHGSMDHHHKKTNSHVNVNHRNHHHHHQAPEVHKKVHFVEHEKITEIDNDGNQKVYEEEKTIDVEADGFIQKKHKNFDSCKADAYKVY